MSTSSTVRISIDSLRESVPSSWRSADMPASLRHSEGFFRNRRGQSLSYLSLFPQEDDDTHTPLRGVVVYLHGLGDHARRCFHVYEQLCEHGFGVVAYDLLSHGQSESCEHRRRAHARKFRYFVDDTNEFVAFAKRQILPKMLPKSDNAAAGESDAGARPPLILGGYSYGTLVALHTVLTGQHRFDGIFLVAPTVAVDLSPILRFQSFFAKPLSALAPRARIVPASNYEMLCRDPALLDDLFSDPLAVPEKFMTVRMGAETLKAFMSLQQDQALFDAESAFCTAPVLFMMGSADQLSSLPVAVAFFERIRSRDKQFKAFPGMYHSLFDDPEKDEVFEYLMTWLQARFPVRRPRTST